VYLLFALKYKFRRFERLFEEEESCVRAIETMQDDSHNHNRFITAFLNEFSWCERRQIRITLDNALRKCDQFDLGDCSWVRVVFVDVAEHFADCVDYV
jgi:hypothetical protein